MKNTTLGKVFEGTHQLRAYASQSRAIVNGTFKAITFEEVKAWAIPVPAPCTYCNEHGHITVNNGYSISFDAVPFEQYQGQFRNVDFRQNLDAHCSIRCGACNGTKTIYRDITPSHVWFITQYGDARQAKVNGKVKVWKRDPNRIALPLKYGLRECFTFDKQNIDNGELLWRLD